MRDLDNGSTDASKDFDNAMKRAAEEQEKAEANKWGDAPQWKEIVGLQEEGLDFLIQEIKRYPVPDFMYCWAQGFNHYALLGWIADE